MSDKICAQTNVAEVDNSAIKCEKYTSTDCVIYEEAATYLGLPENSSMTNLLEALLLSLIDARNRILILESSTLETPLLKLWAALNAILA